MSVLTYSNFVNEATIKQLEVGTKVLFTGKFSVGGGWNWDNIDLAGKTGVVSKKIALAINRKGEKLLARAIIWRLDDGRIYMDRIYSVTAAAGLQLEKFAKSHKMLMYDHIRGSKDMIVTLKDGKEWHRKHKGIEYPYFDSFEIAYKKEKTNDLVLRCFNN